MRENLKTLGKLEYLGEEYEIITYNETVTYTRYNIVWKGKFLQSLDQGQAETLANKGITRILVPLFARCAARVERLKLEKEKS